MKGERVSFFTVLKNNQIFLCIPPTLPLVVKFFSTFMKHTYIQLPKLKPNVTNPLDAWYWSKCIFVEPSLGSRSQETQGYSADTTRDKTLDA